MIASSFPRSTATSRRDHHHPRARLSLYHHHRFSSRNRLPEYVNSFIDIPPSKLYNKTTIANYSHFSRQPILYFQILPPYEFVFIFL